MCYDLVIKKSLFIFSLLGIFIISSIFPGETRAAITIIRDFSSSSSDGRLPCAAECKLVQVGSVFYGMTEGGGSATSGTLFKINTNGTGFTILKSFAGGVGDGYAPLGYPTIDGSVIYGMTYGGGLADWGVIFKINTDGTGFNVLHEFSGGLGDGASPRGSLLQIGSTLYGMTSGGGDFAAGTIFKINTDGTGFVTLHEFTGDVDDGSQPYGNLILNGSTLYGVTSRGGDGDIGTIFKINTNGTGFTLLREFQGGANDGSFPYGSLLYYSSKLYGLTQQGGNSNLGVLFQINTDGTGFSALHKFTGAPGDGSSPDGSLIEYNGKLYGFGYDGGVSDLGTIFSYDVAGSTYITLDDFSGSPDVQNSSGTLTFDTSTSRLYGMTNYGGAYDLGSIFYYQTSEPTPTPTSGPVSTPTNSPSANQTSTSNSGDGIERCNLNSPSSAPNLFQINVTDNTATLYFSPAGKPYSNYFVSFGNGKNNQGYGAIFNQESTDGVISFKVSDLKSNSIYTFKVRGGNGCATGEWSKDLTVKTSSSKNKMVSYYPQSVVYYVVDHTVQKVVNQIKQITPLKDKTQPKKMKNISGENKVLESPKVIPGNKKSIIKKILSIF